MERTTDLAKLQTGADFIWGELVGIHEVGDYAIVEYHPWKSAGVRLLSGDEDNTKVNFSCYMGGKSLSRSTNSLDSALAECIAYKHEGLNSKAAGYFIKMITKESLE